MSDRLDHYTRQAMRAYCKWELGAYEWADALISIVEDDNPMAQLRHLIGIDGFNQIATPSMKRRLEADGE